MAQENKSKVSILTNGIIKENPVLRLDRKSTRLNSSH